MGISTTAVKTLFFAKKAGINFNRTLTLGRQHLFAPLSELHTEAAKAGLSALVQDIQFKDPFAEPLFRALGATVADSMDFSAYEGAGIIHDLNRAIPEALYEQYDLVFDGGTLEHVFHFPQAVSNCMKMLKTGGYFISITPTNNFLGHGFYQFSPELYFRIFSPENGFETFKIFVRTAKGGFYEVKDPNEVQSRVTLINGAETDMVVIARRVAVKEIFATTPQQSDYAATWQRQEDGGQDAAAGGGALKSLYRLLPSALRDEVWKMRYKMKYRKKYSEDLGHYNPDHFKKADF